MKFEAGMTIQNLKDETKYYINFVLDNVKGKIYSITAIDSEPFTKTVKEETLIKEYKVIPSELKDFYLKNAFKQCNDFIDKCTPEELNQYEIQIDSNSPECDDIFNPGEEIEEKTDYEQWKDWLDKWKIEYEENEDDGFGFDEFPCIQLYVKGFGTEVLIRFEMDGTFRDFLAH